MSGDFGGECLSESADSPFGDMVRREEREGAICYNAGGIQYCIITETVNSSASPWGSNQFSLGALLDHLLRGYLIAIEHAE